MLPHWPSQLHQPEGVDEFVEWLDGIYAQGKGQSAEHVWQTNKQVSASKAISAEHVWQPAVVSQ